MLQVHLGGFYWAPQSNAGWWGWKTVYCMVCRYRHRDCCSMLPRRRVCGDVCGDVRLNLCPFISQCTTGLQPHLAPESHQSDSGPVRLLKTAIAHTHSHNIYI